MVAINGIRAVIVVDQTGTPMVNGIEGIIPVNSAGQRVSSIFEANANISAAAQAQARQNIGISAAAPTSASAWTQVAGLQPTIAMDFVNDRYYGGASLLDIVTVRSGGTHQWKDSAGNVFQFAANQVRRSDLGLYLDTNDAATLTGVLAALIQANATTGFTLLAEFGISELVEGVYDVTSGPNNQCFLGGTTANAQVLGRGANGTLAQMYNGTPIVGLSSSTGGNSRNFDSNVQAVAISCDASGNRAISTGGGAVVTGTGGIGTVTTLNLGKYGGGTQTTGMILRSLRIWPGALTSAQLQLISFYAPTERKVINWGDSLAGSSGLADAAATGWITKLRDSFNPDGVLFAAGLGGDTTKMVLDRFNNIVPGAQADADPVRRREWVHTFWTGHNDPSASDTIAGLRAMIDQLTGEKRYLINLPLQSFGNAIGSAGYQKITDIRALIRATFPASRVVDIPTVLGETGGYTPAGLRSDDLHLNQTGYDLVWPAVRTAMIANGW